jgi:hypothetical protein
MALAESGCGFWIGDGGGADGIPGDCDTGGSVTRNGSGARIGSRSKDGSVATNESAIEDVSVARDVVNELSVVRLDDSKDSSAGDDSTVLTRLRKRPLLSRSNIAVIFMMVSVCVARGDSEVFWLRVVSELD